MLALNKKHSQLLLLALTVSLSSHVFAQEIGQNTVSLETQELIALEPPASTLELKGLYSAQARQLPSALVEEPTANPLGIFENLPPAEDPYKLIEELTDPNAPIPSSPFFGDDADIAGKRLDKTIPLDRPLTDWQKDMLDPIELDISSESIAKLNLSSTLFRAMQENLPYKVVNETVIRDRWAFWNSSSRLLPDVFLSYNMTDRSIQAARGSLQGFQSGGTRTFHQFGLGINYDLSGSEVFNTIASYYDWMANVEFQGSSLQDLLREASNRYFDVMRSRGELAVRIEGVKQAKIQLQLNERLEQAGVGTRFAVLQATEQMAETELSLISQQALARISEIRLLNFLNLPLGTNLVLEENALKKRTLVSQDYEIFDLVEMGLGNRPDITRRSFSYQAAKTRIWQAVADFGPTFSLNANTTSSTNSVSGGVGAAFRPNNVIEFRTIGLGIDWTIGRGLGLGQISSINQRKAEARAASFELQNAKLSVETEVRESFLRSKSAEKQIGTSQKQLDAATEAIKLARIRLANGVGTNIDLLDIQRNYVDALINKVRSIIDYNQSQVDLLRATGLITPSTVLHQTLAFSPYWGKDYAPKGSAYAPTDFEQADYDNDES